MEKIQKPNLKIAQKVLPKPLLKAIQHIFAQGISGCALVGGTALSGFYAGHRKSDDIDLFTDRPESQKMTLLAVKSLRKTGAGFSEESSSAQYYRTNCEFEKHRFTIDVVEDTHLFRIGSFVELENGIKVASLETLLKMKAATLVSRASEKDLYDLIWLRRQFPKIGIKELIELGKSVDGGVTGENILSVILGTRLREEACAFSIDPKVSAQTIYNEIKEFKKQLEKEVTGYLKRLPTDPLGALSKKARKVLR